MEISTNRIKSLISTVFMGWFLKIITFIGILILFFFSIELMVKSLTVLGEGAASQLIQGAEMPFIAIFIGLLSTALIQSSSSVTSIAVAIVASQAITLEMGIYIIMGANVGTTLTSNIVSLGFITNRRLFRQALAAATVHDFFNMMTVVILFPLEHYYHVLSNTARMAARLITSRPADVNYSDTDSGIYWLHSLADRIYDIVGIHWLVLAISVLILVLSIKMFSSYSYKLLIGGSRDKLKSYIFNKPFKSFSWGVIITGALQSSSITTSLVVPLVATHKITLHAVFPFILGANLGTTITALMAGFFKSEVALSLAMAHVLFNLIGVLIFLPFSSIRGIPEYLAIHFGRLASKRRLIVFFYILMTFFIIPFILIYLSK
ncbi:MAG: Na/Pi cotransporter family protein [Cyclobacteriaceae bacterium]|nr:Na/Pi cotransporter family protein [Cyclobacteriaceae bacterium]